ncbi:MAG: GNAT family N-acetyltransferase [Bacteroides sp.]|nr:GNAT family N-acetyltransferase [Bacteroides sp.]
MNYLRDGDIRLRAVEPTDAECVWEFETDSTHWYSNGMMAPYSKKNIQDYAENYDADPIRAGQLRMIVDYKDEIAGIIDLYDISPQNRTAFIGVYIKSSLRKQGLASRCLNLIENYASQLLNLRIVAAKISEDNNPSKGLFLKSGYIKEAEFNNWLLRGKDKKSLLIYTKKLI